MLFVMVGIRQSDYPQALEILKEVFNGFSEVLGPDHPDTLRARRDIGCTLNYQNKYDEALIIYEETSKKFKQVLGEKHPDTLSTMANLASVFLVKEEYKKALDIYYDVYEKQVEVLGKKSYEALKVKYNIASTLILQNNHHDALKNLKKVFNGFSEVLGPDHPDTLITKQDIEILKTLITNVGFQTSQDDVNRNGDDSITLHSAINDGDTKAIIALLDKGADITQVTSEKGNTVLHISTSKGNNEVIKLLLEYAKQLSPTKLNDLINAKTTTKGNTALHVVSERGNLHVVKLLLENGAVYNAKNKDNKTPSELTTDNRIKDLFNLVEGLFENVKIGNNQQVVQCLKKEKAIVNARDNNGGTPLYWTISKGDLDTANILLDNDADPTLVTNKGNTPLHMASNKEKTKAVKVLLTHVRNKYSDKLGQFINAQTTVGETSALHIASDIEVTRSLLQYGSVYNIKNKEGKTPLDLAKNDDIRKLLSFTNELFEGVKNGNRQVISKLRNLEVDDFVAVTNARNDQGHTLLQVAIANKHRDIATELSKMLKNLAPSSSMESVNVAGPSRSHENLPS